MVMPFFTPLAVEWLAAVGSGAGPKLGRLTTLSPPETETPGTRDAPWLRLPAPPGPGIGELPVRSKGLAARPSPTAVEPEPTHTGELPELNPRPIPLPFPAPPAPGAALPVGDIAKVPFSTFAGRPGCLPG